MWVILFSVLSFNSEKSDVTVKSVNAIYNYNSGPSIISRNRHTNLLYVKLLDIGSKRRNITRDLEDYEGHFSLY